MNSLRICQVYGEDEVITVGKTQSEILFADRH